MRGLGWALLTVGVVCWIVAWDSLDLGWFWVGLGALIMALCAFLIGEYTWEGPD